MPRMGMLCILQHNSELQQRLDSTLLHCINKPINMVLTSWGKRDIFFQQGSWRILFHKVNLGIIPVFNLKIYLYCLQELQNPRALTLGKLHSPIVMTHQSPTDANDPFCSLCVSKSAHFKKHYSTLSYTKLQFDAIGRSATYELTVN